MMSKILNLIVILLMASGLCSAQSSSEVVEDFKSSSVNQPGKEYPMVNSEGRVRVQISAPEAEKVQLDISAVKYDLVKDENGVWTGESAPQDEGFHYYQLWVDGNQSTTIQVFEGAINVYNPFPKSLPPVPGAPSQVEKPREVVGPQEVRGPSDVSREEWTQIVLHQYQQITVTGR